MPPRVARYRRRLIISRSGTCILKKSQTAQQWNAKQELTTEEKSNQAGASDASKLTCAHLVENPHQPLPNDCDLVSKPSASASESGVFHLGANQLLIHADGCAEIVVVVNGHNGSWRVIEQKEREQKHGFPSHRRCRAVPTTLRVALIGSAGQRFLAQVQRVWCSILRKRDERRHSTTLCQNEGLRIDCHCLHHFDDTPTIICRATSQATPVTRGSGTNEEANARRPASCTANSPHYLLTCGGKVCAMMAAMPQHDRSNAQKTLPESLWNFKCRDVRRGSCN